MTRKRLQHRAWRDPVFAGETTISTEGDGDARYQYRRVDFIYRHARLPASTTHKVCEIALRAVNPEGRGPELQIELTIREPDRVGRMRSMGSSMHLTPDEARTLFERPLHELEAMEAEAAGKASAVAFSEADEIALAIFEKMTPAGRIITAATELSAIVAHHRLKRDLSEQMADNVAESLRNRCRGARNADPVVLDAVAAQADLSPHYPRPLPEHWTHCPLCGVRYVQGGHVCAAVQG